MGNIKTAMVVLWLTLTLVVAVGSSVLKNKVQVLERRLNTINDNIQKDIQTIHVLNAEWSHYNTPERLRKLAMEQLSLDKARPEQIINYSALPLEGELIGNPRMFAKNGRDLKKLVNSER